MKSKVYLETSIISYLTSYPSGNVVIAGHQLTTLDWWENHRRDFEVFASELVVQEAGLGDTKMARKRLDVLKDIQILAVSGEARDMAKILIAEKAVPGKAAADALHIAIATVEKIDFLATWNFKHIANAQMKVKIEEAMRTRGYKPTQICTLEEIAGE